MKTATTLPRSSVALITWRIRARPVVMNGHHGATKAGPLGVSRALTSIVIDVNVGAFMP